MYNMYIITYIYRVQVGREEGDNGREWPTAFHTVVLCMIELNRQGSEKNK